MSIADVVELTKSGWSEEFRDVFPFAFEKRIYLFLFPLRTTL